MERKMRQLVKKVTFFLQKKKLKDFFPVQSQGKPNQSVLLYLQTTIKLIL